MSMDKEPKPFELVEHEGTVSLVVDIGSRYPDNVLTQGQAKLMDAVYPNGTYSGAFWYPYAEMEKPSRSGMSAFRKKQSLLWLGYVMLTLHDHSDIVGNQNAVCRWIMKHTYPIWKKLRKSFHDEFKKDSMDNLDVDL